MYTFDYFESKLISHNLDLIKNNSHHLKLTNICEVSSSNNIWIVLGLVDKKYKHLN